jgi:hypothetical protein
VPFRRSSRWPIPGRWLKATAAMGMRHVPNGGPRVQIADQHGSSGSRGVVQI